jgi:hypothetical protein
MTSSPRPYGLGSRATMAVTMGDGASPQSEGESTTRREFVKLLGGTYSRLIVRTAVP